VYFKQFLHDETGCASYFLASRQSREAMVVDPQLDIQPYLDLAQEREYRITDVVDTHLHADHVSGNRALRQAADARLWLYESADVQFDFEPLRDKQDLHLGQLVVHVVHTPGHRPESVCLLVTNPPRSPAPGINGRSSTESIPGGAAHTAGIALMMRAAVPTRPPVLWSPSSPIIWTSQV